MRVCGVTFIKTMNYGSCLQAYALQTVIDKQRIGGENCRYSLLPISDLKGYPSPSWKKKIMESAAYCLRGMFKQFENKYIHFADCDSFKELDKLNEQYDAFVCGSDVIWNPRFNRNCDAYYLKFAKKYAFSYAASFGRAEISDSEKTRLPDQLSQLREIGVREESGQKIIKKYTGRDAVVVLDPVVFLRKEEWDEIAEPKKLAEPYIFVYFTHQTEEIVQFYQKLSRMTGYRVIITTTGFTKSIKAKTLNMPTPQRWLRLLRDAAYVVTNSFHATAFSVIYHKQFFTVMKGEKTTGINIRMYDFLRELDLLEHMLNHCPDRIDTNEIDFSDTDSKLDKIRQESMAFLQENLEKAYDETHNIQEAKI